MKAEVDPHRVKASEHALAGESGNATAEQREREKLAFGLMTLRALVNQVQHLKSEPVTPSHSSVSHVATDADVEAPTATAAAATRSSEGSEAKEVSDLRRISVEMQAGDLGRVALRVDRGRDGMRIELGIEDAKAVQLALMQRKSLQTALESRGMEVASVNVSQVDKTGIPFARSLANDRHGASRESERSSHTAKRSTMATTKSNTRSHKRIKLIG